MSWPFHSEISGEEAEFDSKKQVVISVFNNSNNSLSEISFNAFGVN